MSKVFIHENFTESSNDIALLRLGKKFGCFALDNNQLTDSRVDLSVFSPVCLPDVGEGFVNQDGHVYGEQFSDMAGLPCP